MSHVGGGLWGEGGGWEGPERGETGDKGRCGEKKLCVYKPEMSGSPKINMGEVVFGGGLWGE